MSDVADYDTDILLWSERQAELLRGLKTLARGLPNELDIENLAEEIETVGRSEFRAFESYVRQIFVHLIKMRANPDKNLRADWISEIYGFKFDAERAVTPSMLRRLNEDRVWNNAVVKARASLLKHGEDLPLGLPDVCPFSFEELLQDAPLDIDAMLARLDSSD